MSYKGIAKGLRETSGPTELAVGAVADGEFLSRSGSTIVGTTAAGTPPGTWTQLGKGPTSVANDVEATLLSGITLAAGEVPKFIITMKTTPTTNDVRSRQEATDFGANADEFRYNYVRETGTDHHFHVRHNEGGSRDFDWVVFKVLPA